MKIIINDWVEREEWVENVHTLAIQAQELERRGFEIKLNIGLRKARTSKPLKEESEMGEMEIE